MVQPSTEPDPWEPRVAPVDLPFAHVLQDETKAKGWLSREMVIHPPSGEVIRLVYRWLSAGDFERLRAQATAMHDAGNQAAAAARMITGLVYWWNLSEPTGQPLSIDMETCSHLPPPIRQAINEAVVTDYLAVRSHLAWLYECAYAMGHPRPGAS